MAKQNGQEKVWTSLFPALAEDVVYRDVVQRLEVNGRSAMQKALTTLLTQSFNQIQTQLLAIHAGQDVVLLELRFKGRHCGKFGGIPPTNRLVSLPMTVRFAMRSGRIQQISLDYDAGDLLRQLGFIYEIGDI